MTAEDLINAAWYAGYAGTIHQPALRELRARLTGFQLDVWRLWYARGWQEACRGPLAEPAVSVLAVA